MKKTKVLASIILGLILSVCFAFGIGGIKKDAKKVSAWTQSDIKYFGYDISVHQGVVDFNVMKNYADFVICRIGYSTSLDTRFLTYMRDAKAAGLHIGIYIFSLAENTTQAQNEADWIVSTLAANGFDKGYLDFPVFFDYEVSSVIQSKTKAENSAIVNAFVDRMSQAGYYSAMYVGGSNYKSYFDHSTLKCSAWVAHYGYSDQVSYFEARYSGYNTCMWQFDGDGYDTASTKRGTAVGASSTNIDHNWCFVDFPTIIKDGGYNGHSAKINKEVADSGNWVTTNNYDRCNENFDSRSITLSSAKTDENPIDFINDNSSEILATATFKLNGKVSSELTGKIGISLINGDKGMFFYADAKGTTGTDLSNIAGNSFGVVYRANNAWDWATDTAITGVTYDINKEFTLKVVKENKDVKLYVNDALVKTLSTTDFGVTANATCQVQIRSFQINATVTKYLCTPTMASVIKIDGDFTDWANLPNYNSVVASKKTIFDKTDSLKGAEFFVANTKYGLFVYAKATHDKDFKDNASWKNNTNVEMFLVDSNNQYWANHQQFSGFSSAYFNTKKVGDRYQTNFEGFISSSSIPSYKIDLKYGLAFNVDNGTSKDNITPTGSTTATSCWCAENSDPKNVAHIISNKVAVSYDTSTSVKFKDSANFTKLGNTISIKTTNTTTNTDVLHLTSNNTVNQTVSATFSITGKYKNEGYAKLGLSFIDEYGDGFFFYADAAGGSGSSLVSSITGTTFGLVYCNDGVFYWTDSKSIALSGANFSASSPFTMKIERANTVAKLYVGNTLMHTISDTTKYYIQSGQVVYPSITTFNTYFDVTNVSVTPIDNSNDLTIDGNLSDWKALSNWDKIDASKATITDSLATGKQATFYTRLVDSGLYVYMLANHNVNVTNYLESEWWKNTNFEMFINGTDNNSQLYATALFDKGFTNCVFTTTESSGKFVTIFEGFIDIDTLVGVYGYTTNYLNVGMAFKVDNLGGTADSITPQGGTATSYWCANNIDPRDIGIKVEKLVEEITPPTPPTSSSSSSSSSSTSSLNSESSSSSSSVNSSSSSIISSSSKTPTSSSVDSSSSSSPSVKPSSSSSSKEVSSSSNVVSSESSSSQNTSSSQTISSTQNESSSTVGTAKKKGCGGSINATALIGILAIFAIIIFTKRQSKRM